MRELVEVELSNGRSMWACVESYHEPRDVGLTDHLPGLSGLPGFAEVVEWVGTSVATGLRDAAPDQVTAEFGVELAVGGKGIVAALGGVGGKAHVKVTLTWGGQTPVGAVPGPPPPQ